MPSPTPPTPDRPRSRLHRTFRSLRQYNYRLWAAGALVSNIGTWMQRIAQDWLVLTVLTRHSGTAVGVVMALQFGPPIVLLPWVGRVADRVERRRILLVTQAALALTALGLGALVLGGVVRLWHVYVFAGLMGSVSAFDAPVRQTFVAELVGDGDLPNAVALNSLLFNGARLVGPAVAGLLIAAIGTGWVFVLNAASFLAVLAALLAIRTGELHPMARAGDARAGIAAGLAYVRRQPEVAMALAMLFLVGTYGFNFPIFISKMAVTAYRGGPGLYGALSSAMAVGAILGALHVAGDRRPTLPLLARSAAVFGVACTLAAAMPGAWSFGAALVGIGAAAQTFSSAANSLVQLSTEPAMRGRVMAIYMGIFMGCTPLGAPLVGWFADAMGPRWALAVGAASGFAAALVMPAWRALANAAGRRGVPVRVPESDPG